MLHGSSLEFMAIMIVRTSAWAVWAAGMVMAITVGRVGMADDPGCATPTFAYGNAGFASGYSRWVHGFATPTASCPTPRPVCGPCWRPCLPRSCGPSLGGWPCRPSWNWGCFGIARYACHESVFLSVSPGSSATFFSGCFVPSAIPWYPSACPPMPWLSAVNHLPTPVIVGAVSQNAVPRLALTDRGPPLRMSHADARRRARKLVDAGDRHLRDAVGEQRKLAAALSAYRRAAIIAPDLPEPLIRQAIVLVALDRQADVSEAVGAVAAIDPRLADTVADRGTRALREIWQGEAPGAGEPPLPAANWIADRWTGHWHPEATRLASAAAPSR